MLQSWPGRPETPTRLQGQEQACVTRVSMLIQFAEESCNQDFQCGELYILQHFKLSYNYLRTS